MGRNSKLSLDQWDEIERRHFVGHESMNSLGKEYGLSEAAIRKRFRSNRSELKNLAQKKVNATLQVKAVEAEIRELPPERQRIVNDLARALAATSSHLASASELSSETAAILARLANETVKAITSTADPEKNFEAVKTAMVLQAGSNDASQIGLRLLTANKDNATFSDTEAPAGLGSFYGEEGESQP